MRTILIGSTAFALVLLATAARAADEKKPEQVPLDKAPKTVQDAFNNRFPGGKITSLTKETDTGKVIYDIELSMKGLKYEMDVLEDGTVLEVEKEMKLADVPAALAKTVDGKYPGANVQVIMEVNLVKDKKETPEHYEVTVQTADKKEAEILITLDGKGVKEEKK